MSDTTNTPSRFRPRPQGAAVGAPTVLSLFAGVGGIDLGLHRALGATTAAYSEVDPYACRVLARHHPTADDLGDVTTIDWSAHGHGAYDIIAGGFPCQDISVAGKGGGVAAGHRSGLWRHLADAIRVIRPRGVLLENVPAILHRGLDRVLGDLAACGYDAEWDCVPAAALGAPHRRDRWWLVAYPHGAGQREQRRPLTAAPQHPAAERHGAVLGDRHAASAPVEAGPWPAPSPPQWQAEPAVGRVTDGLPNRVDRLRGLGNAVVPQVAEHVARVAVQRQLWPWPAK